jgi:dolichyl-diphosphooligosaccharide--protein glycosyltransferase
LLGFIAWLAGAGNPSEQLLHVIAAWYPAVLGASMVAAIFLLGRLVFGMRAGLVAAAIIATLPGHYLRVSSLGFTDHHILESLLATLFFYFLLRAMRQPDSAARAIIAGLTLSAYLLTFHGAAFLPAIVVGWACYDRLRSLWPREDPAPSLEPLYRAFLIAFGICLFFSNILWMNYTILTLALGILAIGALDAWLKWSRRLSWRRVPVYALLAIGSLGFVFGVLRVPSVRHAAKHAAERLMPGLLGTWGGVNELQSLIYRDGHYTLLPALQQLYGAFFLALLGLILLAEATWKRANTDKALIFFWGLTTFVLAMGQLRMTYYYAIAVALASAYVVDGFLAAGRKTAWVTMAGLVLLILGPNLYAGWDDDNTGIPGDWREALDWMRTSTPEPFGDPAFYYARYDRRQFGPSYQYPPGAYSVMSWWDYGYWLETVARRIPVTNPTQKNAEVAADFLLAQSEAEAAPILKEWRTRYVVLDALLPIWPSEEKIVGDFPKFFDYAAKRRMNDYLLAPGQTDAQGKPKPKLFYRPAYYRSIVVRLFVFGGQAVEKPSGAMILKLQRKELPGGDSYLEVIDSNRFETAQEAMAAEAACQKDGCVLVSDNPLVSCVPLEALQQFRPVFSSSTSIVGMGSTRRGQVQVYEFIGAR